MLELLPEGLVLGDKAVRQLGEPPIGLLQGADGALLHGQLVFEEDDTVLLVRRVHAFDRSKEKAEMIE
jgi:hypothetical protein